MNTGYYVGNGFERSITGVGFHPDLVIIKADNANYAVWTNSSMAAGKTAYFGSATQNQNGMIASLDNDGFSIGTSTVVNTANIRYAWTAFGGSGGSDFRVGSYAGDGSPTTRNLDIVGFQPDLVWIKADDLQYGVWTTSAMTANQSRYFHLANATDYLSNRISALRPLGFQVGPNNEVNQSQRTYYYVAFKGSAGNMAVGSYSGSGAVQSITGLGFQPGLMWVKQAGVTTTEVATLRMDQSYGDESQLFSNTANATNCVQSILSDGFKVGTSSRTNASGSTYYYVAFKKTITPPTPTGNFRMVSGAYIGNGTSQTISGVGFQPELLVIKGKQMPAMVFLPLLIWPTRT